MRVAGIFRAARLGGPREVMTMSVQKSFQQTATIQRILVYAGLLFAAAALAAPGSHLVADASTPLLGVSGTLDGFGVPAFSGQVVAFSAKRGTVRGIYADFFDGYPEVHKLVEVNDPTPEGDTYFQLWDPAAEPSSGQVVAFPARTFSAINGYGYGLYRSLGSSAG